MNLFSSNSYSSLWKTVERYKEDDQPRSALETALKIYDKAERRHDFAQMLRAGLTVVGLRRSVSADSMTVDIRRLEEMPVRTPAEEALKHVLLASAYQDMKHSSLSWQNDEARAEYDRQWRLHVASALEKSREVAGVSAKPYRPLFEKHVDSQLYDDDVLSLVVSLVEDMAEALPGDSPKSDVRKYLLYDGAARVYEEKGMRNGAVLMRLKALQMQRNLDDKQYYMDDEQYEAAVKKLYEDNLSVEAGADAFLAYMAEEDDLNYQQQVDLARMAQKQWKGSRLMPNFREIEREATTPAVQVSIYGELPGETLRMYVRHRMLEDAKVAVYRCHRNDENEVVLDEEVWNHSFSFDAFKAHPDRVEEWAEEKIELTLPAGTFRAIVTSKGKQAVSDIYLTSLKLMTLTLPPDKSIVTVVDAVTGHPVAGCKVTGRWSERVNNKWTEFTREYVTDEHGQAVVDKKVNHVFAQRDQYDKSRECSTTSGWDGLRHVVDHTTVSIFTDRAVYRPGQTVHMSAFAYHQEGDTTTVEARRDVKVILRDANWQVVDERKATTDAYGMVSMDFVLPTDRLNGQFCLCVDDARRYFRVEEYKRPTFTVSYEAIEGNFALGDTVEMTGVAKTYSGVPVQGAMVKWSTKYRTGGFWGFWYGGDSWTEVENGEAVTDEDGRFRVKVFLDPELASAKTEILRYQLDATVTDLGGESHDASNWLSVSDRMFGLDIRLGGDIDRDHPETFTAEVKACNANGKPVAAAGTWQLLALDKEKGYCDKEVATGTFSTDQPVALDILASLPLGKYRMKCKSVDERQHDITTYTEFTLWASESLGKMNIDNDFIHVSSKEFAPGQGVDVWTAMANEDAYTYLYIVTKDHVVRESYEMKGTSLDKLHIDYKTEYGDGVQLLMAYVKNGSQHTLQETFTLVRPDKRLKLQWKTFRDKLTPGQQETWTLSILDKDGKPVPAQLLATMYDASLDAIASHYWSFGLGFSRSVPHIPFSFSSIGYTGGPSLTLRKNGEDEYERQFSELYPFSDYCTLYGYRNMLGAGRGVLLKSARMVDMAAAPMLMDEELMSADGAEPMEVDAEEAAEAIETDADDAQPEEETKEVEMRENFNETAFFLPSLMANKKGDVTISFTLPESLTEWKFMGWAHTKDVDYGQISSRVVARKEFMVQPNMPRFVRIGDDVSIATRIINMSETAMSGTAVMRLVDPETGKTVYTEKQSFTAEAGKTTAATFRYAIDDRYAMLICEITAQGAGIVGEGKQQKSVTFSDGERNWLPVLTDKKFLTESVPFFIDGKGEVDIDLSSLFNQQSETATQRTMTFEYTDNPSWSAVMALHTVLNPEHDNAIAWASAYYANRVAQSLARRMPRLQTLIQQWKQETGKDKTLQSELEKNQELKEILLLETPWVLDAQDETQQRNNLCELFDTELLGQRIAKALEKLAQLQYDNGGWAWFDGMQPNYYTTLTVCEDLAMLRNYLTSAGEQEPVVDKMLEKGIRFLEEKELEYYDRYGYKEKDNLPSESTFRYMYLKVMANGTLKSQQADDVAARIDKMQDEYLDRTEKNKTRLTIYGKANVSVILQADGRTKLVDEFIRSLYEYTVFKPGMGRYFDTEKAQYSWMDYKIPTQLATMRAFLNKMKADAKDGKTATVKKSETDATALHGYLNEMQLWLLRQKQAQKWDNVINTIGVVDMLLSISPEITFHEVRTPAVTIGTKRLTVEQPTAGLGHTKTVVPQGMVDAKPLTAHVKVEPISSQYGEAYSWGCVYGQCLEQIDRVQQSDGSLTIVRKTYLQTTANGKTEWVAMEEGQPLRVGDKLRIRYIVTADRDMDFVQVRAQHAACLEPLKQRSGYQMLGGRGCYLALHDASSDLFFDRFYKGTATLDLEMYVTREGQYIQGVATIQCAYAPAFCGHSKSETLHVGSSK